MNLNEKVSFTLSALIICIMLVTAVIVSLLINRQNQQVSNQMIVKSFNLFEEIIADEQQRLGVNTSQLAEAGNMGEKIRFLSENRDILGYLTVREMYEQVARTVFNAIRAGGIWKAAIYDNNSKLICFALFEKDRTRIGYIHHKPVRTCRIAQLKPEEDINFSTEAWQQTGSLPSQVELDFSKTELDQLELRYEIVDNSLCLTAIVPIVAQTYNTQTEEFERCRWGVVKAVKRFDQGFIDKVLRLTGNHLNIFIEEALSVGSLENYAWLIRGENNQTAATRKSKQIDLNEIRLPASRYYQGIADIDTRGQTKAAVSILQSAAMARENTWQVIKMLFLVTLVVLSFLLPVALFLVNRFFVRPVVDLTKITSKIADGELDKRIVISGKQDELGTLARSFSAMQESIKNRIFALQKAEEKYRNLFEFAPDGICITTSDGNILSFNNAFFKMTGRTDKEKVYQSNVREYYVHPEERKKMLQTLYEKRLMRNFDLEFRNFSGTAWPAQVSLRAIKYEEKDAILAIIRDLSKEKKAQQELYYLRSLLGNIIDAIPSAIIGIDQDIKIILWNARAQQMFHLAPEEAIGQMAYEVIPVISKKLDEIAVTVFEKRPFTESKMPHKIDGEIRFFNTAVYPLTGRNRHEAVIRIDDITEQARLEEMIIQSEKMVSLGGVAAGMAHEINNPLAGILQNAYVLEKRLTADIKTNHDAARACGIHMGQIRSYMEERELISTIGHISQSGKRAAEIVRNMLSFARMEKSEFSDCRLDMLLDDTVELARTDYNLKKKFDFKLIQIKREYIADMPHVRCSKAKIQQTFFNILQNGAQAMSGSGTCDGHPPGFELKIERKADDIRISIKDNGPGMDAAVQKRIFEPFFTTKAVGTGTGLGMSVSYFIITQEHKGTLSVRSVPGQGAEFIITLPINGIKNAG